MFDAITTLDQLAGSQNGANRLICMIGAKNFIRDDREQKVTFKFMRGAANKANHIRIQLMGNDTYTVTFIKIWGTKITEISKHEGIYNDMLKNLFEGETSLYLSI